MDQGKGATVSDYRPFGFGDAGDGTAELEGRGLARRRSLVLLPLLLLRLLCDRELCRSGLSLFGSVVVRALSPVEEIPPPTIASRTAENSRD